MTSAASQPNSLEAILTRRIARLETRTYDWDALKFQADYDKKYRRAQLRYVGTGGTGVEADDNFDVLAQSSSGIFRPNFV